MHEGELMVAQAAEALTQQRRLVLKPCCWYRIEKHFGIYVDRPVVLEGNANIPFTYRIYDRRGRLINYFVSGAERVACVTGKPGRYRVCVTGGEGFECVTLETDWFYLHGWIRYLLSGCFSFIVKKQADSSKKA